MQTAPHVNFKGNCREAFNFYAETFGGRIVFAMTYGEAPGSENAPAEVRRQIIHARVDFGGQYLLGCDAPADRYQAPQGLDRKSTRLYSSHGYISYAVFCLKKKKTTDTQRCVHASD